MPNTMNRQQLIERLNLSTDTEMMRHDLEEILEIELNKPAEDIDSQLVAEIMELLEEHGPTQAEAESTWSKIQRSKKKRDWKKIVIRCVASAASIVLLFVFTLRTAEAFRWTFLLKWMQPVAETFGLYNANEYNYDEPDVPADAYTDDDTEYQQIVYETIEDMPKEIDNVRVVPPWMPDSCEFVQGTIYKDPDLSNITSVYMRNDEYFTLIVTVFSNDASNFAYEFEMTATESGSKKIANHNVTIYCNAQGEITSYSWISNKAHYVFNGFMSDAELAQIIDNLMH